MVEYRETFDREHFCRKVTGILNILDVGETGYYKIGYTNDGIIKPLTDLEVSLKSVERILNELTASSQDPNRVVISPDPIKYLIPEKEGNTIIIKILGNLEKPYFYQGNLCVRKGRETTIDLKKQQDILEFIAKNNNYKLLNDPVLIDWKQFMCNTFLRDDLSPAKFKQLSERTKIGTYVTREELIQIQNLYDFVKSSKWLDDDKDLAAKNGLLKVIRATEKTLNHIDRMTKQRIDLSENLRVFVFAYCNGFDPQSSEPLSNPSSNRFSPPGYYSYGDERKSLIELLEKIFPK